MIRPAITLALLLLTSAATLAAPAYPDDRWYDFETCPVCSQLSEDPALLDHVTWESRTIASGAVTVTTVDPDYAGSYRLAVAAMAEIARKAETGEIDPISRKVCGRCQTYGQLLAEGVKVETLRGDQAEVTLVTATAPELVARIHAFVARNIAEAERREREQAGHDHP